MQAASEAAGGVADGNVPHESQSGINTKLAPEQFVPMMAERPEYERIAACVKGGKTGCTCYSDQATKLTEISREMCLNYVENGLPFDQFCEPEQPERTQATESEGHSGGAQIDEMGGQPLPSLSNGDSKVVANIQ